MRLHLLRKLVRIEKSIRTTRVSRPLTARSFPDHLEQRIRLTGETYEEAGQVLVSQLPDHELAAFVRHAESLKARKGRTQVDSETCLSSTERLGGEMTTKS
jgi:hypothetical protein